MKKEQLQERLNKVNTKINDRLTKIEKLCKKTNVNLNELLNNFNNTINKLTNNNITFTDLSDILSSTTSIKYLPERTIENDWIEENVTHNNNIYSIRDSLIKLYELIQSKQNYQIKLTELLNEENIEKIEIIWTFLSEWEKKTIQWFKYNAEKYYNLYINYNIKLEKYKNSYIYQKQLNKYLNDSYIMKYYRTQHNIENMMQNNFYKNYYNNINDFTKCITHFHDDNSYSIEENKLINFVEDEKVNMYKSLIQRVTSKIGKIIDAKNLSISCCGELNGIIIGELGKVKIETISAGGYNIQRFHYRVLLHVIK